MMRNRPRVIVITGGIGTGKSAAVDIIKDLGYRVLDSDKIVHEGYKAGSPLYVRIVDAFGEEVSKDGKIDRQKLGRIVFNDEEKLRLLNSIVHGYVYEKLREGIESCYDKVIFLDIPLILETRDLHEPIYDEIWLVYVSEETQRKRLRERALRENKNPEDVLKIIDKQIPIEDKVSMVDLVINNEGTLEELKEKIQALLEEKSKGW